MFSSENVNGGFSAIGSDELESVNGGADPLTIVLLGVGLLVGLGAGYVSSARK